VTERLDFVEQSQAKTKAHSIIVPGRSLQHLDGVIPEDAIKLLHSLGQQAIPAIAKNPALTRQIDAIVRQLSSSHQLFLGDSQEVLTSLPDESVHLIVTSPPYWTLKPYPDRPGQLGLIADYEAFLDELDHIWRECFRLLVPGGRLIIVVGDVCLPRRRFGRHVVFPLHASIQERCRRIGFDNLAPIIWYKIANAQLEAAGHSGSFLGKPYEPNAIIKNDIEFILFQRRPGGYRSPSDVVRILSVIPEECHQEWFRQVWTLNGASTHYHPAPFPLPLAERLIRMFSFVGDTVLDPFMGTGTANVAAAMWGRNSIGIEIEPSYLPLAIRRLEKLQQATLTF
jgi:DNA modification methylase